MAGSYYEVEVRPEASGWSARLSAQIDPVTRAIAENLKRQLQQAVRDGLNGTGVNTRVQGTRTGAQFADAFSRAMKSRIEAAVRSLPKIKLDATSTGVDREMADIRRKLEAAGRAITLGVDTKLVDARLDELRRRLETLAHSSPDIRVRVNSGTALAELEALKRSMDGFDRKGFFSRRVASPFKSWFADLRQSSNLVDTIAEKAGKLGGITGSLFGSNLVGTLALVSAIVALVSTVGPIVAGATAGVIGLAGVAGVAALAVIGLQKQAAQQTGFGDLISRQVLTVKNQFAGLGQIAANALGPAIRDLLAVTQRIVPTLEPVVKLVSTTLGGAARSFGTALLTGIQKSAPLFADVAGYIEKGGAALARWVASPSFDHFLTYARQQLPILIGYAKDFGVALIATFVALAPVGENVLKVLDLIFKGITKVAPALRYIVDIAAPFVGVTDLFGSLFGDDDKKKAAASTSAIDSTLRSLNALSTGAADVGAATAPLDNYAKSLGNIVPALVKAQGGSDALGVSVNLIDQRMRASTPSLQAYIDAVGSYDAASAKASDTAGLLGAAFTAARGNALDYATAMLGADTATQGFAKTLHDNITSVAADGTLLGVSHLDAAGKFVDASDKYSQGSSDIVAAFQTQVKAATDAATATYTNELATKGQATAAKDSLTIYKGYRQSLIDSAVAAGTARDTAEGLADQYFKVPTDVDTFVKLLGQSDVSLAIDGLTAALTRLSDFIGAPKVALDTSNFTPQQASVVTALNDLNAQRPTPAVGIVTAKLDQGVQSSADKLAILSGITAAPSVTLRDRASDTLAQIQGQIFNLRDKTIVITTIQRLVQQGAAANNADRAGAFSAAGNIFTPYAAGGINVPSFAAGIEKHVPQIAKAGAFPRVWAEPETKGEAYIPLANDWRRPRAEQILANVAQRFGMAAPAPTMVPSGARASGAGGSGLVGLAVTIDAGSIGTLTGHVVEVADQRIASSDRSKAVHAIGPRARSY